uniref:Granulin a n=1 Tax=Oryzias sinensis TaxID=183150 RepID=A0A8C7YGY8_9TELE
MCLCISTSKTSNFCCSSDIWILKSSPQFIIFSLILFLQSGDIIKVSCTFQHNSVLRFLTFGHVFCIQADSSFVQCSAVHQCPEHMSCCRLFTGEWGCCPLPNAVCCGDKEHCCPEGYTCDLASKSCHKLLTLQLETVPLTPVFLPDDQSQRGPVKPILNRCDDVYSCNVDETCCRTSHTTWGCCLSPNAMCCRDMKHCCPDGYRCTKGGSCIKNTGLHWLNWHTFFTNKRKAIIV